MTSRPLLALAAALVAATPALADIPAVAATDLNLRSGPGPEQQIVGLIPANGEVAVIGCLDDATWCRVDYGGTLGWAAGEYLTATLEAQPVVLYDYREQLQIESLSAEGEATGAGAVGGAALGAALVGGPAALAAGAILGAATGSAIAADDAAVTYVRDNPLDPVYLNGEVVLGAGIPAEVEVVPIPGTNYGYLYVNGLPVVVDPSNRQIVYIVR
ncbi:DUF1236 domain-containing protein [Rubellimicrobium arenae]|uniref:DUF1236 domain-containing protein n=1 Tax=Rubellimicrobium arenae TaxID=2817372 RepID=UPI001B3037B8|nr:DUF1236 domain-containing protein [Rubellimicrobium arenae]